MTRILLIDDEELFREDLATILRHEGYTCFTAEDGAAGLKSAADNDPHIVLCDLQMPGMSGVEVVELLLDDEPSRAVLIVSAHATVDSAVECFRKGAADLIVKPVVTEVLLNTIARIDQQRRLRADVDALRLDLARCGASAGLVGSAPAMLEVGRLIERVAQHETPVLLTGESGTGKEVVARAIHSLGRAKNGPFVAVNCLAVAGTLFESELFGHGKGAFTGAANKHVGFFETSSKGTLLLDEVGEVPLALQGKLLRAVERREITRVGETTPISIDTRIIGTTNRDLHAMVESGAFRTDLYYRLRVVHIELPPLRERSEDIPALVEHFVTTLGRRMSLRQVYVEDAAMAALRAHNWPGNVRELQNSLERALIVGSGETIRVEDLPVELSSGGQSTDSTDDGLRAAMRRAERVHILDVVRRSGGNRADAARRLGIDPSTLWRKLEAGGGPDEP